MEFDNTDFDKNIKSTQKSLEDFNDYLEKSSEDSGGYFERISDTANKMDFSGLVNSVENISSKFNMFGVMAKRALEDITDSMYRAGTQFARSMTVGDMISGWDKYEQKTAGVMTIMAATGKTVDEVNGSLEKLNWYTDETSYNFTDMVNNIGKFTAAGIDLDDAVSAMTGIGNVASVSGQGIQEASRAMYNFAQAMGTGTVKLQDWKSIENANMATMEFKQTIIETALELGTIKETADGVYETLNGKEFTNASFNEQLREGWFTGDVLIKTLKKYSAYSDEIYKIADNFDTCSEAMANFNSTGLELGEKAFKAAQEAKSFKEAIDSVHDAVSTGWMQTFEYLFGNYEESKKLWTDLANNLWDIFASPGVSRNEFMADVMTSSYDKLRNVVKEAGIEVEDYNDRIFGALDKMLEDQFYDEIYAKMGGTTYQMYESMDELRKNIEFTGSTFEDMCEESGSLQDALKQLGSAGISTIRSEIGQMAKETEWAAYSTKDSAKEFEKFAEVVKKVMSKGGTQEDVYAELAKKGYELSNCYTDLQNIADGTATSVYDLSENLRKQAFYQTHATEAYDKFLEVAKEAHSKTKTLADGYAYLERQGYSGAEAQKLYVAAINGTIGSLDDLTEAEKNAIIWNDENANSLKQTYKDTFDVRTEIGKMFATLDKQDARDAIVMGLNSMLETFVDLLNRAREAWHEILPGFDPYKVQEMAESFRNWAESLTLDEEKYKDFEDTVKGGASIFSILGKVLKALTLPFQTLFSKITGGKGTILSITGAVGRAITKFDKWLDTSNILNDVMGKVSSVIGVLADAFIWLYTTLVEKFVEGKNPFTIILETFTEMFDTLDKYVGTKASSTFGKVGMFFLNVFNTLMQVIGALFTVLNKCWGAIKDFFISFFTVIGDTLSSIDWKGIGEKIASIPAAIVEFFQVVTGHSDQDWRQAYPSLANIVDAVAALGGMSIDNVKTAFNDIKTTLGKFWDWIKEKFGDMSIEDMVVLAFAISMIYLIIQLGNLAGSASTSISALQGVGKNLKKGLNSLSSALDTMFKGNIIVSNIVAIGITLTLLTALLMQLTKYKTSDLLKGVGIIAAIAVIVIGSTALFKLIDRIAADKAITGEGAKKAMTGIATALIGMAASILLISIAINQLRDFKISWDIVGALTMIFVVVSAFSALAAILTNNEANIGKAISIAIVMLVMSAAMKDLLNALIELTEIDMNPTHEGLQALITVMAAFALLSLIASGVKLTSAIAIIILLEIVKRMGIILKETIRNMPRKLVDSLADTFSGLLITVISLATVLSIVSLITKKSPESAINSLFSCVAALAVLMLVLAKVASTDISLYSAITAAVMMYACMGTLAGLLLVLDNLKDPEKAGKTSKKIASAMLKFAGAMVVLAGALYIMNLIYEDGPGAILGCISTLGMMSVLMITLTWLEHISEDAKAGAILAAVFGVEAIMISLAVLTPLISKKGEEFKIATASMFAIMLGLGALFTAMSKIESHTKPMLALTGTLLALTGSLMILANIDNEFQMAALLTATLSLSVLMLSLLVFCKAISGKTSTFSSASDSLLALSLMLFSLSVSLAIMSRTLTDEAAMKSMLVGVSTMCALLVLLGAMLGLATGVLDTSKSKDASESILYMCSALAALSIGIGVLTHMLGDKEPGSLIPLTLGLSVVIAVIIGMLSRLEGFKTNGKDIKESMIGITGCLLAIAAVFAVIGWVSQDWKTILTSAAMIASGIAAAAMLVMAIGALPTKTSKSQKQIKKIPTNFAAVAKAALAISACIAVLTGSVVLLMNQKAEISKAIGSIIPIVIGLGAVAAALWVISKGNATSLNKADKAILAMIAPILAISVVLIALNKLEIYGTEILDNVLVISGFLLALGYALSLINKSKNNYENVNKSIIAMTVAVGLIGGLLIAFHLLQISSNELGNNVIVLGTGLVALAGMLILLSKSDNLGNTIKPIVAMTAAVGVIGLLLALLTSLHPTWDELIVSALSIGLVLFALVGSLALLAKTNISENDVTGPLVAMLAGVILMGTIFAVLTELGASWEVIAAASAGIAIVIMTLAMAFAALSNNNSDVSKTEKATKPMVNAIVGIGAAIAAIVYVGGDAVDSITIALAIAGALVAIAAAIKVVALMSSDIDNASNALPMILLATALMGTVMWALSSIGVDGGNAVLMATGIGVAMIALAGAIKIIAKISKNTKEAVGALTVMAAVIGIIGAVIGALTKYGATDIEKLIATTVAIASLLAVAGIMFFVISSVAQNLDKSKVLIGTIAACLLAAGGAIAMIQNAAGVDPYESIKTAFGIAIALLAAAGGLILLSKFGGEISSSLACIAIISAGMLAAGKAISTILSVGNADSAIKAAVAVAGVLAVAGIALAIASGAGDYAADGAAAIAIMSIGILAAGKAVTMLAQYNWSQSISAAAGLAIVILCMAVAARIAESAYGGALAMTVLCLGVAAAAAGLATLASMDWQNILIAAGTIAAIMMVLLILGQFSTGAAGGIAVLTAGLIGTGAAMALISGSVLMLAVAINIIADSLFRLSTISSDDLSVVYDMIPNLIKSASNSIGAFCDAIIKNTPKIIEAFTTVVEGVLFAIFGLAPTIVLGLLDILDQVLAGIADHTSSIAESVFTIVQDLLEIFNSDYAEKILSLLIENIIIIIRTLANYTDEFVSACGELLKAIFDSVIKAANNLDPNFLVDGLALVASIAILLATLEGFAIGAQLAMTGVLALAGVIGELVVLLGILGGIKQIPGLDWLISEGGDFLGTIGEAIGQFVGGLLAGTIEEVSDVLPGLGKDLSRFMENATSFIEGCKNIDDTVLNGALNLAGAIIAIVGAEFIDKLLSFSDDTVENFGEKILELGEYIVEFADIVKDVDTAAVEGAAASGKLLAEFANSLPKEDGFIQKVVGETKDMDDFGYELVEFGGYLVEFANTIKDLDTGIVSKAVAAGSMLAGLAQEIPNSGGVLGFIMGDNDMDDFGKQLPAFGKGIARFAEKVQDLDEGVVSKGVWAGSALINLANLGLPNTGGLLGWILGNNDLDTFGDQLKGFGKGLAQFQEETKNLEEAPFQTAINCAAAICQLANSFSNAEGGSVEWMVSNDGFITLGENLEYFGNSMGTFASSLNVLSDAKFATNVSNLGAFCDAVEKISNINEDNILDLSNALKQASNIPVNEFLTQFEEADTDIIASLSVFLDNIAAFFENNETTEQRLKTIGNEIVRKVLDGIIEHSSLDDTINAGRDYIINPVTEGMKNERSVKMLTDSGNSIAGIIIDTLKEYVEAMERTGRMLILGLCDGMDKSSAEVESAATRLAERVKDTVNRILEIHSPSKVAYESGNFYGIGFSDGITNQIDNAFKTSSELGYSAIDGLDRAMSTVGDNIDLTKTSETIMTGFANGITSGISNILNGNTKDAITGICSNLSTAMASSINDELSDGIVIKPVVDLSNVENSTGEINSMFTGMALNFDNVNFGGTTAGLTGKIAYSQAKAAEVQNGSSNETSNNSTVTFNQYNTSPKALSRYEIYRQTENQLAMMKGLVAQ